MRLACVHEGSEVQLIETIVGMILVAVLVLSVLYLIVWATINWPWDL